MNQDETVLLYVYQSTLRQISFYQYLLKQNNISTLNTVFKEHIIGYEEINNQALNIMTEQGLKITDNKTLNRIKGIEALIENHLHSIIFITKVLPDIKITSIYKLAHKLLIFNQENIDELKKYLR